MESASPFRNIAHAGARLHHRTGADLLSGSRDFQLDRHWSVNGRFLTQPSTGVQRYAWEIVQALDEALDAGHPGSDGLTVDLVVPPGDRRDIPLKVIRTVERGPSRGHAWEQFVLPTCVKGGLLSLGNTGPIAVRRQIVCMHDLNTRAFPASYSRAFRILQRVLLPVLGRTSAAVATVSHYSADELVRHGVCDRAKIVVVPNGHEHVRRWVASPSDAVRAAAGPDTIVIIGTPAPHKNIGLVMGLADRLATVGLKIAVVGGLDAKVYRSNGGGADASNVLRLGKLSDGELAALLQTSLCLAFPSYVEGFGLPPLEAMALGCPVVASDRASLPEVCGDAALFASPVDPEAWFDRFVRLRSDRALRTWCIERGRERATAYSWAASANLYLKVMDEVDASASDRSGRGTARIRNGNIARVG